MTSEEVLVIGVGNPDRGDDGAGRAVARLLKDAGLRGVKVIEVDGEASRLLAQLQGAAAAIIIDACVSGADPGTIRRFDAAEVDLPAGEFGLSSHGFGLAQAIELARALGALPPRCVVYAIEGECFDLGAPVSPTLSEAIAETAKRVVSEIGSLSAG